MAALVVVAIIALAAGLYIASMGRNTPQQQDMSPNSMESFKTTSSEEGAVVPVVFGQVRLAGNLLWYGNLVTERMTETVETGGKGGGGGGTQEVTTGYKYYMDIWQAICIGPNVTILSIYAQDKESDYYPTTFNSGDDGTFPTEPGMYACPMAPVSHAFFKTMYLGENVSFVPTLHFVVRRYSSAPLTYVNMAEDGINPAAVIYDLLRMAGALASDFNLSSFEAASYYWYTKGYAINLVINKQEEVRNIINRIFTYVDGNIRQDENDRFYLKAWKDSDTAVATLDKDDFKSFTFIRRSWEDVYSDFRANYIDRDQNYTTRTIRVRNSAVRTMIGGERQITIDLTAFNNKTVASARLWELMKRLSYPESQINAAVTKKFHSVQVGDVVEISNEDYGIISANYRVTDIDIGKADENEIKWQLTQMVSALFDSEYDVAGGPQWTEPDYSPQVLYDGDVFELPYNSITGEKPAWLLLAARKGVETGFQCLLSSTGSDYLSKGYYGSFSQRGTLDVEYAADTYAIDDEVGIQYTPMREDPEFLDISRAELFQTMRCAILGGTEVIGFQTVDVVGSSSLKLTGVIRGLMNTPISTHPLGTEIWITRIDDNLLQDVDLSHFYLKFLPYFGAKKVDASEVVAIEVTVANKAETPWSPGNILAVRSGANITVTVYNTTQRQIGAGMKAAESQSLVTPFLIDGSFQYKINAGSAVDETSNEFTYAQAGSHTLSVRQVLEGRTSDWLAFTVGAADGTYKALETTNVGLEHVKWGVQGFIEIMNRNAQILNDTYLKISGLLDVDLTGIADTNAITWNAASSKWIPIEWETMFPTTTTTSTTTSSSSSSSSSSTTTSSSSSSTTTTNTMSSTTTTTNTQSSTSSSTSSTSTTTSSTSTTTTTGPPVYEGEDVTEDVTYFGEAGITR